MNLVQGVAMAIIMATTGYAIAVNKCTGPDGKTSYQDAACVNTSKAEALKIQGKSSSLSSDPLKGTEAKQLPFKAVHVPAEEARGIALSDLGIARNRLKDPDSAKFADVRVFRFEALGFVYTMTCGELNARNSYGGYVGAKPFWVYGGIFTETFDHYLPSGNLQWLMGSSQAACLRSGQSVSLS